MICCLIQTRDRLIGLAVVALLLVGGGILSSLAGMPAVAAPASPAPPAETITVFRSPTCGCCGSWIDHLRAAGFRVDDRRTRDMAAIKQAYGVPEHLASCHTALVGGYWLEGHIPATDVQRLLVEQPAVVGIAVPGMPMGSPGMESGDAVDPYTVFGLTEAGETTTFAEHF